MTRSLAAALITLLCASAVSAQVVKQGTVSGTIVSATATTAGGGTDAVLLTTPASGAFILTQVCMIGTPGANNERNAQIVGSTLGRLATAAPDSDLGFCTTFTPGLFLPSGEELRCTQVGASGSSVTCTVTAVVSKK
jgi:hypothetical protein